MSLLHAARRGKHQEIEELLQRGYDINQPLDSTHDLSIRDRMGRRAWQLALIVGDVARAELLY